MANFLTWKSTNSRLVIAPSLAWQSAQRGSHYGRSTAALYWRPRTWCWAQVVMANANRKQQRKQLELRWRGSLGTVTPLQLRVDFVKLLLRQARRRVVEELPASQRARTIVKAWLSFTHVAVDGFERCRERADASQELGDHLRSFIRERRHAYPNSARSSEPDLSSSHCSKISSRIASRLPS